MHGRTSAVQTHVARGSIVTVLLMTNSDEGYKGNLHYFLDNVLMQFQKAGPMWEEEENA